MNIKLNIIWGLNIRNIDESNNGHIISQLHFHDVVICTGYTKQKSLQGVLIFLV